MKPKIRFNGYKEEWNNICFENIFTLINDASSNVASKDYLTAGRYPIIDQGQDLIIGYTNKSTPLIPDNGYIIFGDHTRVIKYVDFPFFTGADGAKVLSIKEMQLYDSLFLYYLCSSLVIPNTGYNRHFKYLKNTTFHIPLISEQKRIASFFNFLDSLIAASTSRLASLKQIKAASLQAMFPQEGETMPRVRFKGFEGEWEMVLVGNLGTTYSGLSGKTKEDFGSGEARFITFLNVLSNAKIDTAILEAVNVRDGEHQNEVKKGDLLFNTSSETPEEVGMCAVMDEELSDVYLNSFCFGFRVKNENIDSTFIAYLMRSHIGRRIMSILAQGATRYNLSKNNFCNTELLLPKTKKEQSLIANYFVSLDSQIALQTRRLEKLKQIKSACLDNMFV